jgi:hypothetical protein
VRYCRYKGLGNQIYDDAANRPSTLAEAMAALEIGLAEYFEREGIEVA